MDWEEFEKRFCWSIDKERRAKTYKALQYFAARVPGGVLDELNVDILAPSNVSGSAWQSGGTNRWHIYLDPILETDPQERVNYTVAHEFAHVALRHAGPIDMAKEMPHYEERPDEWEANRLARSWGFYDPDKKREYRFWPREPHSLWE